MWRGIEGGRARDARSAVCKSGRAITGISCNVALESFRLNLYSETRSGLEGSHDENEKVDNPQDKPLMYHEQLSLI